MKAYNFLYYPTFETIENYKTWLPATYLTLSDRSLSFIVAEGSGVGGFLFVYRSNSEWGYVHGAISRDGNIQHLGKKLNGVWTWD